MTPSSKISFMFESITANLAIYKDNGEILSNTVEPIIARRVMYFMKKVILPQMTTGEFYSLTSISFNNERREFEEMTAMENILYTICMRHYWKLVSAEKNEFVDEQELVLHKKAS